MKIEFDKLARTGVRKMVKTAFDIVDSRWAGLQKE
jgi:hypothetical protein